MTLVQSAETRGEGPVEGRGRGGWRVVVFVLVAAVAIVLGAIVQGDGPWFVSEVQVLRNTTGVTQYQGLATPVIVDDAGTLRIDWSSFAGEPAELRLPSDAPVASDQTRADFEQWLLGRYVAARLDAPDAEVIWLPPSPECPEGGSFANHADPESGQRHTVTLCLNHPDLLEGDVDGRWSNTATRYGLHELAHVWMYDHLDDQTRAAFVERADLDVWRGDRLWAELGVEHAAETIAWGVAGSDAARYDITPEPTCTELAARFEVLTGLPPLTSCTS